MIALDYIVEQGAARPLFAIGATFKKRKSGCRWFSYTHSFFLFPGMKIPRDENRGTFNRLSRLDLNGITTLDDVSSTNFSVDG